MNLPNKLTVVRMVLVPFFVAALLLSKTNDSLKWVALALFVIASLTDFADGYIARKYNLVTNFGKFMDPLADKILTISGMICLVELGRIPSWIVVIIVAREFIISGFRLVAAENGVVKVTDWGAELPYPEMTHTGAVQVAIRPENILIGGDGDICGRLRRVYYLGDVTDCRVAVGQAEVRVITDGFAHASLREGEDVRLHVKEFLVFPGEDLEGQLQIRT